MTNQQDAALAAITHILGLLTGFLGPLIVYIVIKEEGFTRDQAREALNFQLTVLVAIFLASLMLTAFIGFMVLHFIIGVAHLVLCIVAAVKASSGERYRYPFKIPFLVHPQAA